MVKIVRSAPYQSPVDDEQITDPGRISRLLTQLSKRYSPITIQIPGHDNLYASCIVDVDKPYVLLDEFIPSSGHEKLLSERKIRATTKLDGVDIQFSTTLVRVDQQKNVLTYYMKLPEQLKYKQRRQAYRIRIPMSKQLHVLIDNGVDALIQGELHDLSHGGAGKIIPQCNSRLQPEQHYECAIELPCGEWLFCTVEMRYLKHLSSRNKQFIGAKFIGLSQVQKRLISRCISELELEEVRKHARM